jgi:GT2 family glycosyltransferase
MVGVSFVIPVRNGARWLDRVLTAIRSQTWTGPIEIIAIDDASTDDSAEILRRHEHDHRLTVLRGDGSGAAAAINRGILHAHHPLVAQVDQDVVICQTWVNTLVADLEDPAVAAAQGRYAPSVANRDPWSRVMALDLALRYDSLDSVTDHVCTGNTLYRRSALLAVGLFDESLGYGYDNDISYRLLDAGYTLVFNRRALSEHYWREGSTAYASQQYGFGYGRLELVRKHPGRVRGDAVSGLSMMLQAPLTASALGMAVMAAIASGVGSASTLPHALAIALAAMLAVDRLLAGARVAWRFRDVAGFWFLPVHFVRNLAWVTAMVAWSARLLTGSTRRPVHSMRPRPGASV